MIRNHYTCHSTIAQSSLTTSPRHHFFEETNYILALKFIICKPYHNILKLLFLINDHIKLQHTWVLWFDDGTATKGGSQVDYESSIKQIGIFNTIQVFPSTPIPFLSYRNYVKLRIYIYFNFSVTKLYFYLFLVYNYFSKFPANFLRIAFFS